jgi:peptide/nickel transport system permease protein
LLSYSLKRLAGLLPLAIFVTFVSFSLMELAPGDPAQLILQERAGAVDELALLGLRSELGLDRPFLVRYVTWLGDLLSGNLGTSFYRKTSVADEIGRALPVTLQLAGAALIWAAAWALLLGLLASFLGGFAERLTKVLAVVGTSIPAFWLALALMFLFAVELNWLPAVGREGWQSFILPTFALSFAPLVFHLRLLNANLAATNEEDYVIFARAKGLSEGRILLAHRLRPALPPVISSFGVAIGSLLGGSVIVENIFAWPGMGTMVVEAIFNRDYPIIQGYVLVMTAIYTLANFMVDLVCQLLDPRIRLTQEN